MTQSTRTRSRGTANPGEGRESTAPQPSSKGSSKKRPGDQLEGFTEEERAAMRETLQERRAQRKSGGTDGERDVLAKIAEMAPSDRAMAERIHAIIHANAPSLVPRTWYGMPAYSKGDQVLCYFRPAAKFKTRYATFGFSDEANLDDGHMWATDFALTEMTSVEESKIGLLVRRAVSPE